MFLEGESPTLTNPILTLHPQSDICWLFATFEKQRKSVNNNVCGF